MPDSSEVNFNSCRFHCCFDDMLLLQFVEGFPLSILLFIEFFYGLVQPFPKIHG